MSLATTDHAANAEPTPGGQECPKCGKTLIDPTGLGWCKACGYCKSLADDTAKSLLESKKNAALEGVVHTGGAITRLPLWFWASMLCVAIGIFFAMVIDKRLPPGDNLERATWSAVQLGVGTFVVFLAQLFAVLTIAPEEPSLSFKDALVPVRLWGFVAVRLPLLKECVWAALLGLSLMIGSVAFIGGFQHWFSYLPKSAAEQEKTRGREGATPIVIPNE
jgi:hypothetical protein